MSDSAAPHLVDLRDLRLDTAHALVSQVNGGGPATASDYAHPRQYLQGLIDGLCELSLKDPLTGLANRRHFRAVLEREIDRVTRSGEAALLLMLDIDHFKKVNDTRGHACGDAALHGLASTLEHNLRRHDLIGRLGGEEFAVFLPDTALGQAMQLAERLRKQVAITAMAAPGEPEPIRITISIGLAMLSGQESLESLLARADDALYQAKREGRNRVVQASAPTHAG